MHRLRSHGHRARKEERCTERSNCNKGAAEVALITTASIDDGRIAKHNFPKSRRLGLPSHPDTATGMRDG